MKIQHLPYQLTPATNRFHYYETYWKQRSLEILTRHIDPRGLTLLDFGCGRGETLKMARDKGFAVTGADVDPECIRLSSEYGKSVTLNLGDPVSQFGERSFDVVSCFHVLEHLENPKKILQDLGRIARSFVILAVPNLRTIHRLRHREIALSEVNAGHLQGWDHWHLLNLAERHCGLTLVEWGADATLLPFLSNAALKLFGRRATIRLETGLFRRVLPFHSISIIGLFRVATENHR